jgi:dihydroorotate dehydrogenase (NAD+) catalytic subunit
VTGPTSTSVVIPGRKQDLVLRHPWLNAAGTLGFGDESAPVIDPHRLGGFVTNPISLAPRTPSRGERVVRFPGGVLVHTGHPNPGIAEVIRRNQAAWLRLPCPLIVHVLARSPSEISEIGAHLDGLDPVAAMEVGLLEEQAELGLDLVQAAAQLDIPVLAHIPLTADARWAQDIAQAGVAALVVGAPRGGLPGRSGQVVSGRVYGPCLFPLAMHAATRLARVLTIPLLVGGGVAHARQRQALLDAGAFAAVLDFALWDHPETVLQTGD